MEEIEPTITIVLGSQEQRVQKPIEFHYELGGDMVFEPSYDSLPCHWKYVELICKGYGINGSFDLMFVYDDPTKRSSGRLFVGNWNGGYVERESH